MRIKRLDLRRYGIFTDDAITFGPRVSGVPDLHIVFGPNESGKSTALSAFLDLVYGIGTQSRYGFRHGYQTMRIGGEIEIREVSRVFSRIKKTQNSLLDEADNPISDAAILGDLGGIDRAAYMTMFSMDDETLEKGGESILASKGDLGHLLFAASAGLSGLGQKLGELSGEADRFYRGRSKGELSALKARLADLRKQREEIDTVASAYSQLESERARTESEYDAAVAENAANKSKQVTLQAQLQAHPKLGHLRTLREQLAPLREIQPGRSEWIEELPRLREKETQLATRSENIEEELLAISRELEGHVPDNQLLDLSQRIGLLAGLRSRHDTAERDLPVRRIEQGEADGAIAGILARLECEPDTDPTNIFLSAAVTGALRELIEERSGTLSALATAEEERDQAKQRLVEIQEQLEQEGGMSGVDMVASLPHLPALVRSAQGDDHAARHRLAARQHRELLSTLAAQIAALRPWAAEPVALREIEPPTPEDLERLAEAFVEAEKRIERSDIEIGSLLAQKRELASEIDATGDVVGVMSDQKAATIRTEREETWAAHKQQLDAHSAQIFEAALRHDDIITSSRIANAAQVAHLNALSTRAAMVTSNLMAANETRTAATSELDGLKDEIASMARAVSPALPLDWSLSKLRSWLEGRQAALETLALSERASREAAGAQHDGEELRRRLVDAARRIGISCEQETTIDEILGLLQAALDRDTELKALRKQVVDRTRDLGIRDRKLEQASATSVTWNERWDQLCRGCWLGVDRPIPSVSVVREVLEALSQLALLVSKRSGLADRIWKMEEDQSRFELEVKALATELHMDKAAPLLDLANEIAQASERATAAKAAHRGALERQQAAIQRREDVASEKTAFELQKMAMVSHFGVTTLSEVDAKLRDLERRQSLDDQTSVTTQEIVAALGVQTIELAEEILDALDLVSVSTELEQVKQHIEDQELRCRELFSECSKALDRISAIGGDDAVARIDEQRKTVLLEIEEGARRYLRLKLGTAAAEQALRLYRDQHRSSMMTNAAEAFRLISRGTYSGLTAQPDKDGEILVAVAAAGGSKRAFDLSKGARFQLYLALRVAGYREFAQSRPGVPFIGDDIMETFDDERAEETLKLFAEMAKSGQVIYLTHHRHLCDIARRVCPSVTIHELRAIAEARPQSPAAS